MNTMIGRSVTLMMTDVWTSPSPSVSMQMRLSSTSGADWHNRWAQAASQSKMAS
jgi:hypothetical protein